MYAPITQNRENKPRAVANVVTHRPGNAAAARFAGNGIPAQRKPPTLDNIGSLQPAKSAPDAVTQLKVVVDGQPVAKVGPNKVLVGNKAEQVNEKGMGWVEDRYTRAYKDAQEFSKHREGLPVDVGLARKLGRWYRLPFFSKGEFFVLGENHGAFGYRELMAESNQKGKVLGEGGSHPLLSMTPEKGIGMNESGFKNGEGESIEGNMESRASKALYALVPVQNAYLKLKKEGKIESISKKNFQAEEEWLVNYQKADKGNRKIGKGLDKLPFYEHEGEKFYAKTGSKAEEYDVLETAKRQVSGIHKAINEYKGFETEAFTNTKKLVELLYTNLEKRAGEYDLILDNINQLMPQLQHLALEELTKMKGGDPAKDLITRREAVENTKSETVKKWGEQQKTAMAFRDYAMLLSVLKAKKEGYIMAGMGDWHAQDLKDAKEITEAGIPVVELEEFYTKYTEDAIAPITENKAHQNFLKGMPQSDQLGKSIADSLEHEMAAIEQKMPAFKPQDILDEMEAFHKCPLNQTDKILNVLCDNAGIFKEQLASLKKEQKKAISKSLKFGQFLQLIEKYRTLRGEYDGRKFIDKRNPTSEYDKGYEQGKKELLAEADKYEASPTLIALLSDARKNKTWNKIKQFCALENGKIALLRAGLSMEDLEEMDPGYTITFEEEYQKYDPARSFFFRWSSHVFIRKRFNFEKISNPKTPPNKKKYK